MEIHPLRSSRPDLSSHNRCSLRDTFRILLYEFQTPFFGILSLHVGHTPTDGPGSLSHFTKSTLMADVSSTCPYRPYEYSLATVREDFLDKLTKVS